MTRPPVLTSMAGALFGYVRTVTLEVKAHREAFPADDTTASAVAAFSLAVREWTAAVVQAIARGLVRLERARAAVALAARPVLWPFVGAWALALMAFTRWRARAWLRRNRPEKAAALEQAERAVQAHPGPVVRVYALRGPDGHLLRLADKPDAVALFPTYGAALAKRQKGEKVAAVMVPEGALEGGRKPATRPPAAPSPRPRGARRKP